jgi:hypothetical protein
MARKSKHGPPTKDTQYNAYIGQTSHAESYFDIKDDDGPHRREVSQLLNEPLHPVRLPTARKADEESAQCQILGAHLDQPLRLGYMRAVLLGIRAVITSVTEQGQRGRAM